MSLSILSSPILFQTEKTQEDALNVAVVGRQGAETLWCTHDWTKPTTWYGDSVRVSPAETLIPVGDNFSYQAAYINIIDMTHGYVYDEVSLCTDVSHGYSIIVKVDDVLKTQRVSYSDSGGDFDVDYKAGKITFFTELLPDSVVTMEYSYATTSTWYLKPYNRRYLDINSAKIQISIPITMTDALIYEIYCNVESVSLSLLTINGGPFEIGTKIPILTTIYERSGQLIDEASSIETNIPVFINGVRGFVSEQVTLNFSWDTVRRLLSSSGMELRIHIRNHIPFIGERCTGSFRAVSGIDLSMAPLIYKF